MSDWVEQLVRDLKGSLPGMVLLSLDITDDGALAIGVLRVPFDSRGGWHGPRMLLAILAAADARGLDVVCSPTDAYGSSRRALVLALGRAGFVPVAGDPSGHTMRRPSPEPSAGRCGTMAPHGPHSWRKPVAPAQPHTLWSSPRAVHVVYVARQCPGVRCPA